MTASAELTELTLPAVTQAHGVVSLPGSKSISNRVLLLAALCSGTTDIVGLLDSDDTRVMLQALSSLGIGVGRRKDGVLTVTSPGRFRIRQANLFLGNAGTAFRPLTAALAFAGGDYELSGVARMHERPIGDLVDALRSLGANIDYLGEPGYPPLRIRPAPAEGDHISVQGSVSSQFLTALLLAAPTLVLRTGQDLRITVLGTLISKPYIDITTALMARFGVDVQRQTDAQGQLVFLVSKEARYQSPGTIHVEGDASSASYFMALGLIGQGPVSIDGAGADSIQGDMAFVDTIRQMGGAVRSEANRVEVTGVSVAQGARLKSFDADFNLIPDAAMTAAVLAIYADGPCTLRNIGSWRVKETDRIDAMVNELTKLGAKVDSGQDWLTVHPIEHDQWRAASIHTYDDHRMAMCFSLAAFGPVPVTIEDPGCVAKTFPEYFSVYQQVVS
jgi:3-phosphoshikimate 1-carboxyvinyltransferase